MQASLALYWWQRLITFGVGRIRVKCVSCISHHSQIHMVGHYFNLIIKRTLNTKLNQSVLARNRTSLICLPLLSWKLPSLTPYPFLTTLPFLKYFNKPLLYTIIIFTLTLLNKLSYLLQFKFLSICLKFGRHYWPNGKQLGTWSGSKLFAKGWQS